MIDITQSHLFRCGSYKAATDGSVTHYVLVAISKVSGEEHEILISPKELASPRSMRRVLMNRCILYTANEREHDENLLRLLGENLAPT
ncbi:MAG: hypothetical protein AWU57_2904 [Marinobacter sp. T13-3]|nr:MAG: hypothetical protein AWU57_2904 [Marinobacter sp. T13-3]